MSFINRTVFTIVLAACLMTTGLTEAVSLSVSNIVGGAQILNVGTLGASTAINVGFGSHVVGPAGTANQWARTIVQFPIIDFSAASGMTLVSATLNYNIASDFLEPFESGVSEVRMFTTSETDLNDGNRNVFAGLSGDGGANTPIGLAPWEDGVVGPKSLPFSPMGLLALSDAINSGDATTAIAFREFSVIGIGADSLDEIVLGIPPGNMSIDITAVPLPEPTCSAVFLFVGIYLSRRRVGM